jgi:hypothetical protein
MQAPESVARPRRFAVDGRMRHFLAQPAFHDVPLLAGISLLVACGALLGAINVAAIARLVVALFGG